MEGENVTILFILLSLNPVFQENDQRPQVPRQESARFQDDNEDDDFETSCLAFGWNCSETTPSEKSKGE